MPKYITTYNGTGSGVYFAETKFQAINTAFETLKASGINPDRKAITATLVKKKPSRKVAHPPFRPKPVQLHLLLPKY